MKTRNIIAALSLICWGTSQVFAQQPLFAPLGAIWYYNQYNCIPPSPVTYTVEVTEDSIINGKYCTKLPNNFCHSDASCMNYVYVHQDGSKVFVYEPSFNDFQMIYDFDLQAGDSYPYIMCKESWGVDSVTIYVDYADADPAGIQQLRVVPKHPLWWDEMNLGIVKGVGGVYGDQRLMFFDGCITFECPYSLFLCYQTPNGVNYPPGCVSATKEDMLPKAKFRLYPNPASDYLQLVPSSPLPNRISFRILNTKGKLVKEQVLAPSQGEIILPIKDLAAGTYFLQYLEAGAVMAVERFIVLK